jgi:hypothetical protein
MVAIGLFAAGAVRSKPSERSKDDDIVDGTDGSSQEPGEDPVQESTNNPSDENDGPEDE